MSDTSLQVRTWIDKALSSSVWIRATQVADAAITACPDTPILTDADATDRRAAWEALGQAIGDTETAVAPLRSRIHELRTELAMRVKAVLEPANARVDVVRRILGGWDAQERIRLAAQEAEQRKTSSYAAYRRLVQDQDGDRGVTEAQGSVFDPVVPQAPQDGLTAEGVDPFAPQLVTTNAKGEETLSAGPTGRYQENLCRGDPGRGSTRRPIGCACRQVTG